MLEPDKLNLGRNPNAKLSTHVKPGDVVVLDHEKQTLKILRPDNEKGFINLSFQTFLNGWTTGGEEECLKGDACGITVHNFFNFLLAVTNLIAVKTEFNREQGEIPIPEGEHWELDEHPDMKGQ